MQIKTTPRFHHTPVEMAKIKNSRENNAAEDVEKEERSSIVGRVASWYDHSGSLSGGSSETLELYLQWTLLYHSRACTQRIPQHVIRIHAPLCS